MRQAVEERRIVLVLVVVVDPYTLGRRGVLAFCTGSPQRSIFFYVCAAVDYAGGRSDRE